MRTQLPLAVLATALACSVASAPAYARARVFVASYGNDANPCTFGSPCKTFQQAVNVVDAGGEVTAIDSAGFGTIYITQSVTITSPPGVEAGIVGGGVGIYIATRGPGPYFVQLRGLTLDGMGLGNYGIYFDGGNTRVEIIDCVVRNTSFDGIALFPFLGAAGPNTVLISNTIVSNNVTHGIDLAPGSQGSFYNLRGAIDHVNTSGNGIGINIDGTNSSAFADFAISNSVSDSNGKTGIAVQGNNNVKVEIRDSTLSNNLGFGLTVSNAKVGMYANSLVINGAAFSNSNSGTIFSFGNNNLENNGGVPTGTLTPVTGQ